ncbi:hypothetical protein [Streptomyces sp. 2A115]
MGAAVAVPGRIDWWTDAQAAERHPAIGDRGVAVSASPCSAR